jgi:hypothetical protein
MTTPSRPEAIAETQLRAGFFSRIRHWAIARILAQAAAVLITVIVASRVISLAVPPAPSPLHVGAAMLRNLIVAGLALGAYTLMVRWMERRAASELDLRTGAPQWAVGAVIGAALMAAVYLILWLMGRAAFAPGTGLDGIAAGLVAALLAGVMEELLLRAVFFRIVEEACGTSIALIASAALFGLLHGANPGATLFSSAAIALEAGLLLALAYALTRNLWLAIGIHTGWNFTEGNVFGAQVSGGAATHSLIHSTLTGPTLLTGGAFGPEASVVSIGVCGVLAAMFAVMIIRGGGWRARKWRMVLA